VFAWIAASLTESLLAGTAAALLLAFSYTFWSQAIIAEVYTLHLALVGMCLLALAFFAARPSHPRLAIFFAIYALSFGNHLSMVLLLVPFALFLLCAHDRPRELFRPAVIAMAVAIAAIGALQYLPNVLAVGFPPDGAHTWAERLADFWFDATKADWRQTMVLGVRGSEVLDRVAMSAWDARQQFGIVGLIVAAVGAVRLWFRSRAWAALMWTAYAINTVFAFTYNVGDTHVFFLPSHYFTALFAAVAVAPNGRLTAGHPKIVSRRLVAHAPALLLLLYAGWRAWDTWPAIDRHHDRRGEQLAARVSAGIDERDAVLVSDMDWQSENALLYSSRWERPNVPWVRMAEVAAHFPFFVTDNQAAGRDVVLTSRAAAETLATYGTLFPLIEDESIPAPSLTRLVDAIPRGSIYVLCLLAPPREEPFDAAEFDRALQTLAGDRAAPRTGRRAEVWAGIAGEKPSSYVSGDRPFRAEVNVAGEPFTFRLESWLAMDTFRRAGFGHVLHGRDHALIAERGVSLLWLGNDGETHTAYTAGLYAPQPRYRIPAAMMSLAALP
jgi:hypothetical protein